MSKPGFYLENEHPLTRRELARLPSGTQVYLHEHPDKTSLFRNMLDLARKKRGTLRLGRNSQGMLMGHLKTTETMKIDEHGGHNPDHQKWNGRTGLRHTITFTGVEPFQPISKRGRPKGTGNSPKTPLPPVDFLRRKLR